MVNKITVFAFNGESMCFAHALLNSLGIKPDKPFLSCTGEQKFRDS